MTDFESAGIALTVVYFLSTLPVWIFQHKIQYWDIRSMCTLDWLCPNFVLSNLPIRRSASQITHHQTNIPRSRNRYIPHTHSAHTDDFHFNFFLLVVWLSWNFVRFHMIFQTCAENFSFLSWKTKVLSPPKNFDLSHSL